MPLYIRDDDVDMLAVRLQRLTGIRTKTEAVRQALEHELERIDTARPMRARIAKSLALADAMGEGSSDFDMKSFTDAMWDEA
jgi:antitoxin VapB